MNVGVCLSFVLVLTSVQFLLLFYEIDTEISQVLNAGLIFVPDKIV